MTLKQIRQAKKLTQKQAADLIGVSKSTYSEFERGRNPGSRLDTLYKYAKALDVKFRCGNDYDSIEWYTT